MFFWYREVLSKYAVFTGRASRREYWMFHLANVVLCVGAGLTAVLLGVLFGADASVPLFWIVYAGFIIYALTMVVPQLAVSVRRLHDIGKSGWWMLISFVPFGSWVLFMLFMQEGEARDNPYGPDPKGFLDLDMRVDDLFDVPSYSSNPYAQSARYRAL